MSVSPLLLLTRLNYLALLQFGCRQSLTPAGPVFSEYLAGTRKTNRGQHSCAGLGRKVDCTLIESEIHRHTNEKVEARMVNESDIMSVRRPPAILALSDVSVTFGSPHQRWTRARHEVATSRNGDE